MILVAGAGAIGQLLAARLVGAGHDVECLVRPPMVEPLRSLHITGHTEFQGSLDTITEIVGHYDIAFLTTKAHATARLAAPLADHADTLVSLQNGLGNGEKLAQAAGADRVAVALTSHGVTVRAPGDVVHAGTGKTSVGVLTGASERAGRTAQALLEDAGLSPSWNADSRAAVWTKAVVNAAINPVGALHGVTNGGIADDPQLLALSKGLAAEAWALAQRARVAMDDPWPIVETVLAGTRDNRCSMLQDVEARRPTEIEQITGRMVRLGETLLVSMPRSDSVYGRIKDLEASYLPAGEAERFAWEELAAAGIPV